MELSPPDASASAAARASMAPRAAGCKPLLSGRYGRTLRKKSATAATVLSYHGSRLESPCRSIGGKQVGLHAGSRSPLQLDGSVYRSRPRLRAAIGGSYNWVAMNVIIPAAVLTLDLDEQLVYEAILREGVDCLVAPCYSPTSALNQARPIDGDDKDVRSQLC